MPAIGRGYHFTHVGILVNHLYHGARLVMKNPHPTQTQFGILKTIFFCQEFRMTHRYENAIYMPLPVVEVGLSPVWQ